EQALAGGAVGTSTKKATRLRLWTVEPRRTANT
ncbi:MAG: hypothetical protein ACJAQ3_002850, partial [Planctomycetota bacterium]